MGRRPGARAQLSPSAGPPPSLSLSFFFFVCRVASAAYGSSQARGQIGVAATATSQIQATSVTYLNSKLWKHQILNPLREARDQTLILMDSMLGS